MTTPHRAHFDFAIAFANGGSIHGEGFRLDLPRPDMSSDEIGVLLISHLGLALVRDVELRDLRIVEEPHRGSRGVDAAAEATAHVIDLSHPIEAGLVTYPGLPAPIITSHLTREDSRAKYAPGTEFAMDIITMIGNTGTYIDAPFHRYADGGDLASLDLRTLVDLPAEVFHLRDAWSRERRGIVAATLADRELRGSAVLLDTGWDQHFGRPEYAVGAPFLTEDAARFLVAAGVRLVGIDSLNIDDTEAGERGRRTASCSPRACTSWST
ncbi:cyclase family protein [Microbacterium sp. PMB16]|uniref:cyclase family protein n=1 Tax=Microbacterium sp. PMB16 TaxID=3120157 RepID=UPI003F4BCC7A